jgi:hypothetical protein
LRSSVRVPWGDRGSAGPGRFLTCSCKSSQTPIRCISGAGSKPHRQCRPKK